MFSLLESITRVLEVPFTFPILKLILFNLSSSDTEYSISILETLEDGDGMGTGTVSENHRRLPRGGIYGSERPARGGPGKWVWPCTSEQAKL